MFQDYKVEQYLGYDQKSKTNQYQVLIVDDDFSESIAAEAAWERAPDDPRLLADALERRAAATATIESYSKRQLNVALNLYLLCRKIKEKYSQYSQYIFEKQIKDYSKYVKDFSLYEKQVMQYHIRYNNQKVFW